MRKAKLPPPVKKGKIVDFGLGDEKAGRRTGAPSVAVSATRIGVGEQKLVQFKLQLWLT